jgi:hypothetical protein
VLGALALGERLHARRAGNHPAGHDHHGLAGQVQAQQARIIAGPWLLATGEDYRYPETEGGRRDPLTRLMHRFMDRVILAAVNDPQVYRSFFEVLHLLQPATSFFRPGFMARVLVRRP